RSDIARTEEMQLLWGSGTIQENLGLIKYRISPYSFFQTNTHGTEQLYRLLQEWAHPSPPPSPLSEGRGSKGEGSRPRQTGILLDLYCGSGGIALALAGHFDRVVGVDTNVEAIQDAQFNAGLNQNLNSEFVACDVEEFLKKLPASKLSVQLNAVV